MNKTLHEVLLDLDRRFNEFNANMIAVIHDLDDLRKDAPQSGTSRMRRYVELRERAIRLYNETESAIRTYERASSAKASEGPAEFVESCAGILESIPAVFRMLDETAESVGLNPADLRPSTTFCATMQRVVRKQLPILTDDLRRRIEAAGCPTFGFDHESQILPLQPKEGIHILDQVAVAGSTFELKNAPPDVAATYLQSRGAAVSTNHGTARGIHGRKEIALVSKVLAPGLSWIATMARAVFASLAGKLLAAGVMLILGWFGIKSWTITIGLKDSTTSPADPPKQQVP